MLKITQRLGRRLIVNERAEPGRERGCPDVPLDPAQEAAGAERLVTAGGEIRGRGAAAGLDLRDQRCAVADSLSQLALRQTGPGAGQLELLGEQHQAGRIEVTVSAHQRSPFSCDSYRRLPDYSVSCTAVKYVRFLCLI